MYFYALRWDNDEGMELFFHDAAYDRLEVDPTYSHGLPASVVERYRSRLQLLRGAHAEHDLTAMQCLRFRSVETRSGCFSVHLTDQYSLIVELRRHSPVMLSIVEVQIHRA